MFYELKFIFNINLANIILEMADEIEVPLTFSERIAKYAEADKPLRNPDSPEWFNKETNEMYKKTFFWAAPYDARFPQIRKQRQCFTYYVDFHRCKELMGDDYKPCKFFENVYRDICPRSWIAQWNELVEEGRFPAKFDR